MKADKVIGGILVVFSAIMYYEADKFPEGTFGTLGAGLFPKMLFILMAIAGVVLIVNTFIQEKKSKPGTENKAGEDVSESVRDIILNHKNVLLAFAIFFGYVILMYYFGYRIATFIFMPVLMWVLGPRNKKSMIVIAATTVIVTFAIHYSFLNFLKIFLPTGKLF